ACGVRRAPSQRPRRPGWTQAGEASSPTWERWGRGRSRDVYPFLEVRNFVVQVIRQCRLALRYDSDALCRRREMCRRPVGQIRRDDEVDVVAWPKAIAARPSVDLRQKLEPIQHTVVFKVAALLCSVAVVIRLQAERAVDDGAQPGKPHAHAGPIVIQLVG